MAFLSVNEVRDRLRIEEAYAEADLAAMVIEAEDIISDYLELAIPYDADNVPPRVKTATLLVIRGLYDNHDELLTPAVKSILKRTRKPTVA
ncbi:head-tail connector protein [Aureimonas altamirensis]|uniref:head-tail connector protein n=1 Tax=Aureimonas altamirensis TaxID=370622 RepID=UPI002036DA82|nr:head-tail connector protein [Aureimonas altamirensis]MCM2506069.1 head-tail connector protein [Aureimonas altamirensis]